MKTVRFSQIIAKCGKPDSHLVLVDPKKDRTLQSAVKAHRVMTIRQHATGTKADRGEVGFDAGPSRQFLIFPKSLQTFEGKAVVGINFDLFIEPAPQRPAAAPKSQSRPQSVKAPKKKLRTSKAIKEPSSKTKILPFQRAEESEAEAPDTDVADLKKKVRHAMSLLEQGRQVAAFNLLKRIVGD